MYIDPFWAGVLCMLAFELVLIVFAAMFSARKGKK